MRHNELIAQMRGVALIVVLLTHYSAYFSFGDLSLAFIPNGYYGVAMFFPISGFLITTNVLIRYGNLSSVNLREFYVMRAARILPCLALVLVVLSLLSLATAIDGFAFRPGFTVPGAIFHVLSLTFNRYFVAGASATFGWAVLWSISIEEAFYLFYPIAMRLLPRESAQVAALLIVITLGMLSRRSLGDLYSYVGCFSLLDMGAIAAIAAHRLRDQSVPSRLLNSAIWAGTAIALGTYLTLPPMDHLAAGPSLVAFGTALMLFGSHTIKTRQRTFLGSIGSLSYELYLFHATIIVLLARLLPQWTGNLAYVDFAIVSIVIYLVALSLAHWYSRPLNLWILRKQRISFLKL